MTTTDAIHELESWLKLMDHDPDDSTPLEDAVLEGIDALRAIQRAEVDVRQISSQAVLDEVVSAVCTCRHDSGASSVCAIHRFTVSASAEITNARG